MYEFQNRLVLSMKSHFSQKWSKLLVVEFDFIHEKSTSQMMHSHICEH